MWLHGSALGYFEARCKRRCPKGRPIATVLGRYFAMDRDNRLGPRGHSL